ncbi:MAG: phage head closure protein [Pseudomonadota bacterium]
MGPRLVRRMALEEKQVTADGGGGETVAWVHLGTLWADMRPSRGTEGLIGGRTASRVTHRVTVRAAPDGSARRPVASQRLRLGQRLFDILAVSEDDPAGAYLRLWVQEGPLT